MTELKTIRIGQIDPNPFRNLDEWPTVRTKVDELKSSMEGSGFWDGYMILRPGKRGRYEQAFGHHRLVAMRELWGDDHKVTVTVEDLSDDEMFSRMVNENSETYGQEFYYAVMQPIASLIEAYGSGRIELDPPDPATSKSMLRYPNRNTDRAYTAPTIARKLGWTKASTSRKTGEQPADRVTIALNALELIEQGALTRAAILGLNQSQVATAIKAIRARMRAETADVDSTLAVKRDALQKAESEGDTNKSKALAKEIRSIEEAQESRALKAGKAAVKEIKEVFNPPSAGDIFDAAAPTPVVPTKNVKSATQTLYDLIAKWEGLCLDTDPKWTKCEAASAKAKAAAHEALMRLSERAKNRAKEIS